MSIAEVLRRKGGAICSVSETRPLEEAARILWQNQVGALVVRNRRGDLAGLLSERDVVHAIAEHGAAALTRPVGDFMRPDVITCRPDDRVDAVMQTMTVHRTRHIPVRSGDDAEGERLVGVVSLGDLVRNRLDEKSQEIAILQELNLAVRP